MNKNVPMPDAGTGQKLPTNLLDKRGLADLAGMHSTRWVDDQLAAGMPHLKLGQRRVRIDAAEALEWLRQKYGQQRNGKAVAA
jgi:hypothetical protein